MEANSALLLSASELSFNLFLWISVDLLLPLVSACLPDCCLCLSVHSCLCFVVCLSICVFVSVYLFPLLLSVCLFLHVSWLSICSWLCVCPFLSVVSVCFYACLSVCLLIIHVIIIITIITSYQCIWSRTGQKYWGDSPTLYKKCCGCPVPCIGLVEVGRQVNGLTSPPKDRG